MKNIILLLLLFVSLAFSAIDECKTDVYFGNGILTESTDAEKNAGILEKSIKKKFGLDYYNKDIGKVSYAYNSTHGEGSDLLESALQKLDWDWLTNFFSPSHGTDVSTQVTAYENSIKNGHKVLVIAHSQGNLFAYDAYRALGEKSKNGWMQKYFEAVSIASPMKANIKADTPRIDWDNDTVPHIPTSGSNNANDVTNLIRKINWTLIEGNVPEGSESTVLIPPKEALLEEVA